MTIGYSMAIRNAKLNVVRDAIDAGTGPGKLRFYIAPKPATGGAATTLLSEQLFSDPSFPDAVAAVLTASAIAADTAADATGQAIWARVVDGDDVFVEDGTVGLVGSGADFEINAVDFVAGINVATGSVVITGGNP